MTYPETLPTLPVLPKGTPRLTAAASLAAPIRQKQANTEVEVLRRRRFQEAEKAQRRKEFQQHFMVKIEISKDRRVEKLVSPLAPQTFPLQKFKEGSWWDEQERWLQQPG